MKKGDLARKPLRLSVESMDGFPAADAQKIYLILSTVLITTPFFFSHQGDFQYIWPQPSILLAAFCIRVSKASVTVDFPFTARSQ